MSVPGHTTSAIAIVVYSCLASNAADFKICQDIAGTSGTLVDRRDSDISQRMVSDEFDKVCSDIERSESNLSASSDATQASFGYAGYSLGFGNSSSDAASHSKQAINKVCKEGKRYFLSEFNRVDKTVIGHYAIDLVSQCLKILAASNLEALIGTTEVSTASDSAFYAYISFRAGNDNPTRTYELEREF